MTITVIIHLHKQFLNGSATTSIHYITIQVVLDIPVSFYTPFRVAIFKVH